MKKNLTKQEDYKYRVDLVVDYIRVHIGEKISIVKLAELSAFSPFHFHRIIKAYLGEPIGAFVIRLRLEKAAGMICHSTLNISDIAYIVGYDTPSSLTKAFVKFFGISPTKYRKLKKHQIMTTQKSNVVVNVSNGEVRQISPKKVLYCSVKGDYKKIEYPVFFSKLREEVKHQNLFSDTIENIAIYYDNPQITLEENLRCNVCLTIDKDAVPCGDIGVKEMPGGKFAVFTVIGEYCNIDVAYDKIYGELLEKNAWELRGITNIDYIEEDCCYEKYISDPKCTAPEKSVTEIYIAIE